MKLALQLPSFSLPQGPAAIPERLSRVAAIADGLDFDSVWVMDHFFQIESVGRVDEPMLEGYTTLGFLAAHTRQIRLGTMVTGVTYRYPGVLAKTVTTLDVLSGGRAWLGIGAGWYEREHHALGVPFPPLKQRFELLEDTLQAVLQMWEEGENGPFVGRHVRLAETINQPAPVSQPHPPILIGGVGEKKTLRLVARYADGCNFFARLGPEVLRQKLDVLRQHCAAEGRPYDAIEKTTLFPFSPAGAQGRIDAVADEIRALGDLGFQTVILSLRDLSDVDAFERASTDLSRRLSPAPARS